MTRSSPLPIVCRTGDEHDRGWLNSELALLRQTITSGFVKAQPGHEGHGEHMEVLISDQHLPNIIQWSIKLRHGSTTIQRMNDERKCYVTMDQMAGTSGASPIEQSAVAAAIKHIELAADLMSPAADHRSCGRLEEEMTLIARQLAMHGLAKHGGAKTAHSVIQANGPFGLGRSSGFFTLLPDKPNRHNPRTTQAFFDHLESKIGYAVSVAIEDTFRF